MRFQALAEWLAWQEALHPKAIDLGLDRVKDVFRRLHPNPRLPFTITVGGTNGKGSCVAYLDAILRCRGYRVGTYTSPHLLRYNERICIDGRPVADDAICGAFGRIDRARGDTTLSFFEFGTLAALDLFSQTDLDLQILEVGLGGRLDAVNIIDADAVLLASIDIDHQDWLGTTRESIGYEKAGVLRPHRPAVVTDPAPPVSLLRYADALPTELTCFGRDFRYEATASAWHWFGRAHRLHELPLPALAGAHQLRNAAGVVQLLEHIKEQWPVGETAIRAGLRDVRLRARFEVIDGSVPLVVDVAHNPQAVGILAEQLRQRFPGRTIHGVFALMRDKDMEGVIQRIKDVISCWYLPPLTVGRAATPESLAHGLHRAGVERVEYSFADVSAAVAAARSQAEIGDVIVIFGSFFLVAEYCAQCAELPR
jgi:dihydrofolate synthase/folylpolyglutamate synthase